MFVRKPSPDNQISIDTKIPSMDPLSFRVTNAARNSTEKTYSYDTNGVVP